MCQKLRMYGTFWYLRHLRPSDLVGSLLGLICNLNTLQYISQHWRNLMEIHTLWLSSCLTSAWEWSEPLLGNIGHHFRCLRVFGSVLGYNWDVKVSKGILRKSFLCIFFQFSSIVPSHKYAYWYFPIDLDVPNAWNIKMSDTHSAFGTLGSLGGGFSDELEEFTFGQFQMIILYLCIQCICVFAFV